MEGVRDRADEALTQGEGRCSGHSGEGGPAADGAVLARRIQQDCRIWRDS